MSCNDWRDVVGFVGYYQVSRFGGIRRLRKDGTVHRVLRPSLTVFGYRRVSLYIGGVATEIKVHRIVLEAWVGPCPPGYEGCHNDGDRNNNHISNLRWDSRRNNALDAVRHGTHGNCNAKRVRRSDGREFDSIKEAAEYTNCNTGNICSVCKGNRKTAGGFGWEYI